MHISSVLAHQNVALHPLPSSLPPLLQELRQRSDSWPRTEPPAYMFSFFRCYDLQLQPCITEDSLRCRIAAGDSCKTIANTQPEMRFQAVNLQIVEDLRVYLTVM